jgi:oligoribonuclease
MNISDKNLIWIDLEMTGLDPFTDQIIEIATVVTSSELEILAMGPVLAIHQPENILAGMDEWNTSHHSESGLLERVRTSNLSLSDGEDQTLDFIRQWVPAGASPICGNSICQDRRFLARLMATLEEFFHYRNLDVSTLKELAKRWVPEIGEGFSKKNTHLAQDDILESIAELKYYRDNFLKI